MRMQLFLIFFTGLASMSVALADESADAIALAISILPEELRADASVVRFEDGEQVFLRKGVNGMFCRADDPDTPGVNVWCYPRAHDAYARRWYELAADSMSAGEVNDVIEQEIRDGELEWPMGVVNYNLRGPSLDNAVSTTVIYLPFATGETAGITETRSFFRPWLMYPGTAFAHIMMPGQ